MESVFSPSSLPIDAAEKERLARRLEAWRDSMDALREAASAEEPLFAPELEDRS